MKIKLLEVKKIVNEISKDLALHRFNLVIGFLSGLCCNAGGGPKDKHFRSSYKICAPYLLSSHGLDSPLQPICKACSVSYTSDPAPSGLDNGRERRKSWGLKRNHGWKPGPINP